MSLRAACLAIEGCCIIDEAVEEVTADDEDKMFQLSKGYEEHKRGGVKGRQRGGESVKRKGRWKSFRLYR